MEKEWVVHARKMKIPSWTWRLCEEASKKNLEQAGEIYVHEKHVKKLPHADQENGHILKYYYNGCWSLQESTKEGELANLNVKESLQLLTLNHEERMI